MDPHPCRVRMAHLALAMSVSFVIYLHSIQKRARDESECPPAKRQRNDSDRAHRREGLPEEISPARTGATYLQQLRRVIVAMAMMMILLRR
jgi:hypothetical protein